MGKQKDTLAIYAVIDRSGSMSGEPWTNAITSLNEYVKGLQKEKIEGTISITAFDSYNSVSGSSTRLVELAENVSLAYFEPLAVDVLEPAGTTPLYDAAATVMDRAIENDAKRTVVVILTDGHENASTEYNQAQIKEKVKKLQAKDWEVIFLGANFDVSTYTKSAGLAATKMRNFDIRSTVENKTMYTDLTSNTVAYATMGAAMDMSRVEKK